MYLAFPTHPPPLVPSLLELALLREFGSGVSDDCTTGEIGERYRRGRERVDVGAGGRRGSRCTFRERYGFRFEGVAVVEEGRRGAGWLGSHCTIMPSPERPPLHPLDMHFLPPTIPHELLPRFYDILCRFLLLLTLIHTRVLPFYVCVYNRFLDRAHRYT